MFLVENDPRIVLLYLIWNLKGYSTVWPYSLTNKITKWVPISFWEIKLFSKSIPAKLTVINGKFYGFLILI